MSESPERRHYRRDSRSPRRREYVSKGAGRSSSRRRSPGPSKPYDRRPRDNGYGDRDRVRDNESKKGYSEKDREKERVVDRKRYDGDVKKEDPDAPTVEPEKPNFGNSGLLAKETNTIKGVEVKYNEPPEARKPTKNWRLYVFKGSEQVDLIHIYRQSCYLIGRDTVVTDIPIAHPSCSKQHSAIQYRQISEKNEYGDVTTTVKPFIIDLESTNGTYVNDVEIPKSRYYELRGSDVIKFGTSSREYVLLAEDASA
ncbi:smad nuclear-interacting protein 1 [Kwoniella mangroviensis CBS 10435]|uniref:Smad nuclear-interacting protein 1 n=1 Tax=Kwoniella mangroviensis CBS 10435 TaxID=1331196 RepID=A0A1B9J0E5_9TREE|nr:smad nuclear-interacting protein 1 [Kwoniella mangroviensis CBS 8507]OCF61260.1 smad nuclear-interacting protein 1 [Kwoniella mangroviensis CBS 10435]OCF64922.1 smad nuclear-interacting protein 1 [Kwoniella mangroviensis CBS 8507]